MKKTIKYNFIYNKFIILYIFSLFGIEMKREKLKIEGNQKTKTKSLKTTRIWYSQLNTNIKIKKEIKIKQFSPKWILWNMK